MHRIILISKKFTDDEIRKIPCIASSGECYIVSVYFIHDNGCHIEVNVFATAAEAYKWAMLEAMSVSFTYGFVTNILGVLKFFEVYIPCFRNYAHDCLIEKGTFESPIPLLDIYYEE